MRKDEIPRDTVGKEEKKVEPRIYLDGEVEDIARIEKGSSESEGVRWKGSFHRAVFPL